MKYLEWLTGVVGGKLKEGAIGQPVYLRYTLELTPDHGLLGSILDEAVRGAAVWMGAAVRQRHVQGSARDGYLTALVEFGEGQTALVSVETLRAAEASAQILILGRHGSLRFDDQPEPIRAEGR